MSFQFEGLILIKTVVALASVCLFDSVMIPGLCAETAKSLAGKESTTKAPASNPVLKPLTLQPIKAKTDVSKRSSQKRSGAPPVITVKVDKRAAGSDEMSVVVDKRGTTIFVDHNFGIGSGDVTLASGAWSPVTRIVLRGFGMLEHIELQHGNVKIASSLGSAPDVEVAGGGSSTDSLQMPIKASGKDIVVEVPRDFLDGQTKLLKLRWIDAYR